MKEESIKTESKRKKLEDYNNVDKNFSEKSISLMVIRNVFHMAVY